jgi:hypothetical protein
MPQRFDAGNRQQLVSAFQSGSVVSQSKMPQGFNAGGRHELIVASSNDSTRAFRATRTSEYIYFSVPSAPLHRIDVGVAVTIARRAVVERGVGVDVVSSRLR